MHKSNGHYFKDCDICGKEFEVGKNTYFKSDRKKLLLCPICKVLYQSHTSPKRKLEIFFCEECGREFATTVEELIVHHKNSCDWDIDGRLDLNNGVTLCIDCHKNFHTLYGYGNNTETQFIEFCNQEGSETRARARRSQRRSKRGVRQEKTCA